MDTRELDIQVARKLGTEVKHYSTNLQAAWEIVEFLRSNYVVLLQETKRMGWICDFYTKDRDAWKKPSSSEHADTAPMAICEAFLKL